MILTHPASELLRALTRRFAHQQCRLAGTSELHERALHRVQQGETALDLPPLSLVNVESMDRRPHLRSIQGEIVIVHDETFADTINLLEAFYVGVDRPLLAWALCGRLLSEMVYCDVAPELGLYFADRIDEVASTHKDDSGLFVRPIVVEREGMDRFQEVTDLKLRSMEIQRLVILYHEIGHAAYSLYPNWQAHWQGLSKSLLDPIYLGAPEMLDSEFGVLRVRHLSDDEKSELRRSLIRGVMEEVSCDVFALASLLRSHEAIGITAESAIRCLWRFLQFAEIIDTVRAQAAQRSRNRVRFRSVTSKLSLRTSAFFKILRSPKLMVGSGVKDLDALSNTIAEVDLTQLEQDLNRRIKLAGHMISMAVHSPGPSEKDLHQLPFGFLSSTRTEVPLAERERLFDILLGDSFLSNMVEPEATRLAPHARTAGHLLYRSREWSRSYHSDTQIMQHYARELSTLAEKDLTWRLQKTYLAVARYQMAPGLIVLDAPIMRE